MTTIQNNQIGNKDRAKTGVPSSTPGLIATLPGGLASRAPQTEPRALGSETISTTLRTVRELLASGSSEALADALERTNELSARLRTTDTSIPPAAEPELRLLLRELKPRLQEALVQRALLTYHEPWEGANYDRGADIQAHYGALYHLHLLLGSLPRSEPGARA